MCWIGRETLAEMLLRKKTICCWSSVTSNQQVISCNDIPQKPSVVGLRQPTGHWFSCQMPVMSLVTVGREDPGTKKDAGTAIRASKLSPVGLLRVQDGLILLAAASGRKKLRCPIFGEAPHASLQNLRLPQNLQPPISGEAPRASQDCLHCQLQVQLLRHLVLHTCEAPRASPIIGERKFSLMRS